MDIEKNYEQYDTEQIKSFKHYERSGYSFAITDSQDRIAFGLSDEGKMILNGKELPFSETKIGFRDGYQFVICDSQDRVVFGISETGKVIVNGIEYPFDTTLKYPRSGYSWAVLDSQDRVAFGIDYEGNAVFSGQRLTDLITLYGSVDLKAEVDKENNGLSSIVCWGDSMTQGAGGQTPYPSLLSASLGRNVYNRGVGGQTSDEIICRQGGTPILISIQNSVIPANGGVFLSAISSAPVTLISNPQNVDGYVAGIYGRLRRDPGDVYAFTRFSAGTSAFIYPDTNFIIDKVEDDAYRIHILWLGRNNIPEYDRVIRDYDNAISYMKAKHKKYLIIPPFNSSSEISGTSGYNQVKAISDTLKEKYPGNTLDLRYRIIRSYNPGIPQDVTDFNNDVPPSSLRVDPLHLNTTGNGLIANWLAQEINYRGW